MGDWLDEARRYYTNIVGKYGMQVEAVLKKAATLDIAYVCPLHGFVWRKHFADFLDKYMHWATYTPEKKGVTLAYASVYGHTENMANILAAKLSDRGVDVEMFDTSVIDSSYVISSAFKNSHMVFASTTYNAGIFIRMDELLHDIQSHNLQKRKVALLENGSWGPTSGKLMREILSTIPGTQFIQDNPISILSAPKANTLDELDALADAIAADCEAGNMVQLGVYHPESIWDFGNDNYDLYTLTLDFQHGDRWFYMNIYADCKNILAVLEPTGVLDRVRMDYENTYG
jgi:flavorubredoxin